MTDYEKITRAYQFAQNRQRIRQSIERTKRQIEREDACVRELHELRAQVRRLQRVIRVEREYQPDDDYVFVVGEEEYRRIIEEYRAAYDALEPNDLEEPI